jgi:hypothetical protein
MVVWAAMTFYSHRLDYRCRLGRPVCIYPPGHTAGVPPHRHTDRRHHPGTIGSIFARSWTTVGCKVIGWTSSCDIPLLCCPCRLGNIGWLRWRSRKDVWVRPHHTDLHRRPGTTGNRVWCGPRTRLEPCLPYSRSHQNHMNIWLTCTSVYNSHLRRICEQLCYRRGHTTPPITSARSITRKYCTFCAQTN